MVFNEWGAIIRQQDEVDRALEMKNLQKYRDRQRNYKLDLDEQLKQSKI